MESGKEFVNDPARSAATGTAPSAQPVPATSFTIVGLGASAGGLEAFEQFFRKVQPNSGMAFVLVPHLDPEHESILCEILQRCTAIPVVEVQDQMAVAPDHVYVIPPNRDLAIFHGLLQLSVPEMPRGQRMPIDAFLRSLAEDYGELAVGVILSGTGTDGTLGLRAILGAGGITMVQEPTTAKYDGMPASAIRAGYATHVLPGGSDAGCVSWPFAQTERRRHRRHRAAVVGRLSRRADAVALGHRARLLVYKKTRSLGASSGA
jgi:two-component system, chemotaxis family, CheB/CheR fusion protein